MNVRPVPNKTPTCAFSRFPGTPKGHPSAVDVPLLGYLSSLSLQQKSLYQQPARPSWPQRLASFGTVAGARKAEAFSASRQKPSKLEDRQQRARETAGPLLFSAAPASASENIGSLPQEWSVQSLFGACLFIQVLIWTACLKWGLWCFSLLWYCG